MTSEEPQDGAARPYSAERRTPRRHKRVVVQGTERFDADGVKLEPSDVRTREQQAADDDRRILGELPPHWGVFQERVAGANTRLSPCATAQAYASAVMAVAFPVRR